MATTREGEGLKKAPSKLKKTPPCPLISSCLSLSCIYNLKEEQWGCLERKGGFGRCSSTSCRCSSPWWQPMLPQIKSPLISFSRCAVDPLFLNRVFLFSHSFSFSAPVLWYSGCLSCSCCLRLMWAFVTVNIGECSFLSGGAFGTGHWFCFFELRVPRRFSGKWVSSLIGCLVELLHCDAL